MFDFKTRLKTLQKKMRTDCIVIAQVNHAEAKAFYYSGIEEPFLAYITPNYSIVFTTVDLNEVDLKHFDEVNPWRKAKGFYKKFFKSKKIKSVGLDFSSEANRIGFRLLESRNSKIKIENNAGFLDSFRAIKDSQEQSLIRKAQKTTKECVEEAGEEGFEGKSENEIAGFLEYSARRKGLAMNAFPPIIATGAKTAIPHTTPSTDRIKENILIDCGATCGNYCADFTTTEYYGKSKELKDAVEAVWEAKKAAERKAKMGVSGKVLSQTSLKVIGEYGFGKHSFKKIGLALGHSVGLKVHDGFRLEDVMLKKGMVFTIEPGIYIPKKFGVRFEDIVLL